MSILLPKVRCISAIWFGFSGLLGGIISLATWDFIVNKNISWSNISFFIVIPVGMITSLLGFYKGHKIIIESNSWREAAGWGVGGAILSILIYDVFFVGMLSILSYIYNDHVAHDNSFHPFSSYLLLGVIIFASSFITGGWIGIIIGMLSAILFYLFF